MEVPSLESQLRSLKRLALLFVKTVVRSIQRCVEATLFPLNRVLSALLAHRVIPNSVLHISYAVHIPYYTTRVLRKFGLKADYMAIGESPSWNRFDYQITRSRGPLRRSLSEFWVFWSVVARYEVLHLHFGLFMSESGWELPLLKRMGRKIVVNFRGCEARDRNLNMRFHRANNICQECDYGAYCVSQENVQRRRSALKYGDAFLVTTPDLKDFIPEAEHFPFFAPENVPERSQGVRNRRNPRKTFRIVHATNHPGIEGTAEVIRTVEQLRDQGYQIELKYLTGVTHDEVLRALEEADLSVGKLKMGYYANAQIESMCMGVPAVTYLRPEFMTEELRNSGFIFTESEKLELTLKYYLETPSALEEKKRIARSSILRLHNNEQLARRLITLYHRLLGRS